MIRHPNYNGMQRDPDTQGFLPARFIREVAVTRGVDLVFRAETSFSVAANPNFRFTYANTGTGRLDVKSTDSSETGFAASEPPASAP